MTTVQQPGIETIDFGGAQIHLLNVRLGGITLDELHIEGNDIAMQMPHGAEPFQLRTGDCVVRVVMSEPNINHLIMANLPADAPVRNLQAAFLSGKARLTGSLIKVIGLPFTVELIPRIQNGNRVTWDFSSARIGVGLPSIVVEVLERIVNERMSVDLSGLPVPIWIDEARCEPGRLTLLGKARIALPLASIAGDPAPQSLPGAPATAR